MTAAADLRVGDVIDRGHLPVSARGDGRVVHVWRYDLYGEPRIYVTYAYSDGCPDSTDYLAAAEIPLTSRTPEPCRTCTALANNT